MPRSRFAGLLTERSASASRRLDRMSALKIARLMNREDRAAVQAVGRALPAVARAVDVIVAGISRGGRLFFVGAGTSGRLGVLEAAECPPTFGTPASLVQAIMAGGRASVFRSREGAEDNRRTAGREVAKRVRRGDVVVGISASGVTPFVHAALSAAHRRGAQTILIVCNPPRRRPSGHHLIALTCGPEVLAGSTRLKAGTATKLVLNMMTTASMARLGRVYGNRMIDLVPRSAKLRDRAVRLVQDLAGVSRPVATRALVAAGQRVRVAAVMARRGVDARAARRMLGSAGDLRAVLEDHRAR